MLSSRTLLAALVLTFCGPAPAAARQPPTLFAIARSKNANVVHYDVRLDRAGHLQKGEPVFAYWVLHAEDGRREELTWLERELAYGWSIVSEPHPAGVTLRLTAFPNRSLRIRTDSTGTHRAIVAIAGRDAVLFRIFVQVDGGGLLPRVRYVELSGTDCRTQKVVKERLAP